MRKNQVPEELKILFQKYNGILVELKKLESFIDDPANPQPEKKIKIKKFLKAGQDLNELILLIKRQGYCPGSQEILNGFKKKGV